MKNQTREVSSQELFSLRPRPGARFYQILWKIVVFLGSAVVVGAITSILATWVTTPNGIFPVTTPFSKIIALWPTTLLGGLFLVTLALWIREKSLQPPVRSGPSVQHLRAFLLQRLGHSYRAYLEESLQVRTPILLSLAYHSDAVRRPGQEFNHTPRKLKSELSSPPSIIDAYDQTQGELLILGKPGSGKSILLHQLGCTLVERATDNEGFPLPFILHLSTWSTSQQLFEDWLCDQIIKTYLIPEENCKQWIQLDLILPLLDGLDEMEEEKRSACLLAINAYHREHPMPLVICSRENEYQEAMQEEPLLLQNAVVVQPLTKEQIEHYLLQTEVSVEQFQQSLNSNPVLQEMVPTPLWLGVLATTYRGNSLQGLSQQEGQFQQQVWADYVQQMFERKSDDQRYPQQKTVRWLRWLACQLLAHNLPTFYPEQLQPDWLTPPQLNWYKILAVRFPGVVLGIAAGLLSAPLLISYHGILLLQFSILSSFLGGVLSSSLLPQVSSEVPSRQISFLQRIAKWFIISAVVGLTWGGFPLPAEPFNVLAKVEAMLLVGGSCFFFQLFFSHSRTRGEAGGVQNQMTFWWKRLSFFSTLHARSALLSLLFLGGAIGISKGLDYSVSQDLGHSVSYGLSFGLSYGLSLGMVSLLLSLIFSVQARTIYLGERLKWTWNSVLGALFLPRHFRSTWGSICLSLVFFGLSQGLGPLIDEGLSQGADWAFHWGLGEGVAWGVSWGLGYWFLFGLVQGISREPADEKGRRKFSQRTRDSLRNFLYMTLISSLLIWVLSELSWGVSTELSYGLNYGLSWGMNEALLQWMSLGLSQGLMQGIGNACLSALSGGLLIGLLLGGGLAVLQHVILRLLLSLSGTFPWKQSFLEEAATRMFLLRFEGGYSFLHRLLQEYFAHLDANTMVSPSQEEGLSEALGLSSRNAIPTPIQNEAFNPETLSSEIVPSD